MDDFRGFSRRWRPALAMALLAVLGGGEAAHGGGKASDISAETLELHPEVVEMRQQVAAEPENALLQASLGNMYARLGWDDLAIESYREALSLDESLYEAWTNLGTIYNRQGDLAQAEKAFRKAIDLQPRAALAYYNLGTVLDHGDRYDEALAAYKTAITYDPSLLDPAVNPQVVNNQHLTSIRLMSYLETSGSGALPLEEFATEMVDMLEAEGSVEGEVAPAAGTAGAPPAAGTPSGEKPILGSLDADIQRESRRARRKRLKAQETAAAEAAAADPSVP